MRIDSINHPPPAPGPAKPLQVEIDQSTDLTRDDADAFQYSPKDLDSNGRLHVIVYSATNHKCNLQSVSQEICNTQGKIDTELPLIHGFAANVDPKTMPEILRTLPPHAEVHINSVLYNKSDTLAQIVKDTTATAPTATIPNLPTSGGLDPSRAVIGIQKVWDQGYTGKGVGVAVIDSGIYPHPDLKDRIVGWVDIADGKPTPYDNFGHGTHVAGDIAGSGKLSDGRFKGIAPDANLIGVRITTVAEAIRGIQWVIDNKDKYNIRVINLSLGDYASKSYKDDPWVQAVDKAINAGLVVVVAAGNEGPDPGTISTPGTDPRVITVGALDDKHTLTRSDDTIASFESHGPTAIDHLIKPDVIAPGVQIYAPLSPGSTLDVPELPHIGNNYIAISGTSMATPMVSGLVADLIQADPKLTHDDVKKILEASADRYLKDGSNEQGYGLIDAPRALALALAMKNGAPAPTVPPLPPDPVRPVSGQPATPPAPTNMPPAQTINGIAPRPVVAPLHPTGLVATPHAPVGVLGSTPMRPLTPPHAPQFSPAEAASHNGYLLTPDRFLH